MIDYALIYTKHWVCFKQIGTFFEVTSINDDYLAVQFIKRPK